MKKWKSMLLSGIVSVVTGVQLYAQSPMGAPEGMPDMSQIQAQMQESMKILPFLTAPIEDKTPLGKADIDKFIEAIKVHKQERDESSKKLEEGFKKAANVLKPGVSYDTFIAKAIELSGKKSEMDAMAKKAGYGSALEEMIVSARITRAMAKIQMDKQLADIPESQRAMMQNMMKSSLGMVPPADVAAVTPYADQLMELIENK